MNLQGQGFGDHRAHLGLNGCPLLRADFLEMREIKAQSSGMHQRAALLHVCAQNFTQGMVHQVGGGMVFRRSATTLNVDFRKHCFCPRGWRCS